MTHAVNALPALLDEVEALRAENERLRTQLRNALAAHRCMDCGATLEWKWNNGSPA